MWWLAAALSALHHAERIPFYPVMRFHKENPMRRGPFVFVRVALSVFVPIACVRADLDVVMQGTCLTLAGRVTILPECMCSRAASPCPTPPSVDRAISRGI